MTQQPAGPDPGAPRRSRRLRRGLASYLAVVLIACLGGPPSEAGTVPPWADAFTRRFASTMKDGPMGRQPCRDFYRYTCGSFLNDLETSSGMQTGSWPRSERYKVIDEVLDDVLVAGEDRHPDLGPHRAWDFYEACRDTHAIQAAGRAPLQERLARVDAASGLPELLEVVGWMHAHGLTPLWGLSVQPSADDPGELALVIVQGGLGFGPAEIYEATDRPARRVRRAYERHVADMLRMAGTPARQARQDAAAVVAFETALASFHWPPPALRDAPLALQQVEVDRLAGLAPELPWDSWLAGLAATDPARLEVLPRGYHAQVAALVAATPETTLKAYLRWCWTSAWTFALPSRFGLSEARLWGKVIDRPLDSDRSRECRAVTAALAWAPISAGAVPRLLEEEPRLRASRIVDGVREAMVERLRSTTWLDPVSRDAAAYKIGSAPIVLGGADPWPTEEIPRLSGSFFDQVDALVHHQVTARLARVGQAPGPTGVGDMTQMNAWYIPRRNAITLPAGILGAPWLDDVALPDEIEHAGLGAVVGHELAHAIDASGRRWAADGRLAPLLSGAGDTAFEERLACYEGQLQGAEVTGVHVDPSYVMAESLADVVGLQVAWDAWKATGPNEAMIRGRTREQLFFLSYGQTFCSWRSPMASRFGAYGSHVLPAGDRLNFAVANHPAFAETFGCREDDWMVVEEPCSLW